jgi:hypothetical protein
MNQCNFRSQRVRMHATSFGTSVAMSRVMIPCNVFAKNLEAAVVVAISTGLAIAGANFIDRSGPDRELLRQLRERSPVVQLEQGEAGVSYSKNPPPPSPRPLPLYAQR